MQRYTNFIASTTATNSTLTVLSNASCVVYIAGTLGAATLYSDNAATPTPLANPFLSSATGMIDFYAANGRYDVVVSKTGYLSVTISDIELDDLLAPSGSNSVGYLPAGTGAVATTVQTKLRESVSVKDFGAVGDGTTDDTAELQTAMAAAGDVGFYVGNYNIPTTPSYSGSQTLEVGNGAAVTGAGASALGLIVGGISPRQLVELNTTGGDAATSYVRRIANHSGGTPGWVSNAFNARTDVLNAGATNYEWAILGNIYNYSNAGENVAVYGFGEKKAAGPTWGMVAQAVDTTNVVGATSGLIGIEVDVFANGADTSANRVGVDITVGKGVSVGTDCVATYGLRIGPSQPFPTSSFVQGIRINSSTFGAVVLANAGVYGIKFLAAATLAVGVDLSQGTYSSSSLRLALRDARIDLEVSGVLQMDLAPATNVVRFLNSAVERVGLDLTTPALRVGATKVVGVQDAGFAAFTGTTNKATAYATGTVTLVQLAERVAALQASLTTHGLIAI